MEKVDKTPEATAVPFSKNVRISLIAHKLATPAFWWSVRDLTEWFFGGRHMEKRELGFISPLNALSQEFSRILILEQVLFGLKRAIMSIVMFLFFYSFNV